MNDMGAYSGLYDQIREYAVLLDKVLIALKSGKSDPHDLEREQLSQFLLELTQERPEDPSFRILSVALRESPLSDKTAWKQMAQALQKPKLDSVMLNRLEGLAQLMEEKRAGTFAKMRGWSR